MLAGNLANIMDEIKTEFEVLRRYKMKGGGIAKVSRIHILNANDRFPVGFFIEGNHHEGERWATATGKHRDTRASHPLDLLLPAIEPEGAPAKEPLSSPTVSALESYMDFWAAFRDAINLGLIDPTDGGYWPEWDQDATIHRAYPTQEAALADCQGIIAAIKRLLEGQSHD